MSAERVEARRRRTVARVPNYVPAVADYLAELHADGILPQAGDVLDVYHDPRCDVFGDSGICDCSPSLSLRRGLSISEKAASLLESWRDIRAQRRARRN
jgi:hypothetical protein